MRHPTLCLSLPSLSRLLLRSAAALALLALGGCATRQLAAANDEAMPFDQAIEQATDALMQQSQAKAGFMDRFRTRQVALDPTLDAGTGQQTVATERVDRALTERITRNFSRVEVLPFRAANLSRAPYLITGTLAREQDAFRLNLALVDLKSGTAVAQSSARARADGVDMSPLAYYRDSPVLVKDKLIDGQVRTSTTAAGQHADPAYLERIAAATVINDATVLYNAERYQEALDQYRSALATPAGDQLRVLNGIYLSSVKLGQMAEAEEAFGRVVAFGIAYNELGVKLLFNPGGTEFWSDPKVSGVYGMWLRQIAREGSNARACMDIIGHTSKTGSEAFNNALSLKRAGYVRQRLGSYSPAVARRAQAQGMGFRQNIVGSGTDDGVDALDRRVEFKIVECKADLSAGVSGRRQPILKPGVKRAGKTSKLPGA